MSFASTRHPLRWQGAHPLGLLGPACPQHGLGAVFRRTSRRDSFCCWHLMASFDLDLWITHRRSGWPFPGPNASLTRPSRRPCRRSTSRCGGDASSTPGARTLWASSSSSPSSERWEARFCLACLIGVFVLPSFRTRRA